MDVRCNRCGTEYEFDDALISERGTTVKCTNCGLQFKVYPKHHSGGPERWVVRTGEGRELVFTSLRELQRGIADRKVGPGDMLTRGQKPPRPLGSIAELEPFFQSSLGKVGSSGSGNDRPARTLHGVAPPANSVPSSQVASTVASPFPYTTDFDVPEPPRSPSPQAGAQLMDALSVTMPEAEGARDVKDARAALVEIAGAAPSRTLADAPRAPAPSEASAPASPKLVVASQLTPEPPAASLSTTLPLEEYERQRREAAVQRSSPQSSRMPLETVARSSPTAARGPLDSSPRSTRGPLDSSPRPPISSRGSFHSYDEL
ncbi:MAG TPA: zinc-ribbon domain-containing protein, partial [Polyangiaceae bacterium]|nr:zinc-ribbon domain-containing protein [Polyangiaceae bacterium]